MFVINSFQFNPADFDYSTVISILLKALTAAPFPDFNLCIALLGEAPVDVISPSAPTLSEEATDEERAASAEEFAKAQAAPSAGHLTDPLIAHLAQLSSMLLSARFRAFWQAFKSPEYQDVRQHAAQITGFEDAVRRVALHSVKSAFTQISTNRLGSYLDLSSGNELADFMKTQPGWKIEGEKVHVPINADNEVKATVIREDIQLDQLTRFLSQAHTPMLRAA